MTSILSMKYVLSRTVMTIYMLDMKEKGEDVTISRHWKSFSVESLGDKMYPMTFNLIALFLES